MNTERAETLASRGLTDKNIIIEILKEESPVPERLPAEMYDKVNYMCRRWTELPALRLITILSPISTL